MFFVQAHSHKIILYKKTFLKELNCLTTHSIKYQNIKLESLKDKTLKWIQN
jgi:hypothetical protein